jgi:aminoglycoside phosphotransferase (APT) family kinase protein
MGSGITKSTTWQILPLLTVTVNSSYGVGVPAAPSPHLDLERIDAWIGERLPGAGQGFTAQRLGAATGIANALYLIERGAHRWVLRRPPAVKNDPSASSTLREWRILNALESTPVPHPAPVLLCEDTDVLGAPFLIMEVVDGFTPGFELPEPFAAESALRYDLGMAYIDGCAELSMVDWRANGLEGLGKPDGFLERQVPRWLAQLDRYRTRDLPELDFLCRWLTDSTPPMSPAAIIHGDYSPFNVMVAPDPPARLAAILDWDTGTIGDPLLDLGHLLARWTESGERPVLTIQAGDTDGYPTRADMAKRYADRTGRDLSALAYYEVLALFKLAVILEGSHARESARGVPAEGTSMATIVPGLLRGAAEFARGERT